MACVNAFEGGATASRNAGAANLDANAGADFHAHHDNRFAITGLPTANVDRHTGGSNRQLGAPRRLVYRDPITDTDSVSYPSANTGCAGYRLRCASDSDTYANSLPFIHGNRHAVTDSLYYPRANTGCAGYRPHCASDSDTYANSLPFIHGNRHAVTDRHPYNDAAALFHTTTLAF
jgi:hypothetical protein